MSAGSSAFDRARRVIPGGVNSPVRAFRAVGGHPVFVSRGEGCRVRDVDGREYVDYVGSWGPLILGHRHPGVVAAIREATEAGWTFGMPTERETLLAEVVAAVVPSVEKVRFVSSGTEATMSAIRLARGVTGRDAIVKLAGCYHGHADSLLVKAGSGVATLGIPGSPGVPAAIAEKTFTVPYNDAAALERLCAERGSGIACLIAEPVAGNMGCVPPQAGWLARVREITARHGILFICDEVMTGFRLALGGAQERFGFTADLVTMGKILGGGLPAAAYGGAARIMDQLAPDGPVYQAGTLSGNPLAMSAGLETLRLLGAGRRAARAIPVPAGAPAEGHADPYGRLETIAAALETGLADAARAGGVPVRINRVGSMMTVFFTDRPVTDWDSAAAADTEAFSRFFRGMLSRGVLLPPSQFEAFFVSLAHTEADVALTLEAARSAFREAAAR